MREGLPSATAAIVACARGASGVDPIAQRLVPPAFAVFARPWGRRLGRLVPLVALMRVRTLAIDDAVRTAAEAGTKQVVVLGAGLCARAWRMSELGASTVFEVDHPATQRYKRRRLEGLVPLARAVELVSVDFEKDDLVHALEAAGHDAAVPTTWIWEGVTPYLTPFAIAQTLRSIRARSAASSTLSLTYYTERDPTTSPSLLDPRRILRWSRRALSLIGEPFIGVMTTDAMVRILAAHGFRVESDVVSAELAARDGGALVSLSEGVVRERIVVARV